MTNDLKNEPAILMMYKFLQKYKGYLEKIPIKWTKKLK